jgi:threonine dehydrogenase-like Zn-dependent dehydrogenase
MRRLIRTVESDRLDRLPLIAHPFALGDVAAACDLFSNRREGVLNVAITP